MATPRSGFDPAIVCSRCAAAPGWCRSSTRSRRSRRAPARSWASGSTSSRHGLRRRGSGPDGAGCECCGPSQRRTGRQHVAAGHVCTHGCSRGVETEDSVGWSGGSAVRPGQGFDRGVDQVGDGLRLRDVDGVAAGDFADRGAGALGHGALGRRRDHPVIGGDQVPARLEPPPGLADGAAEGVDAPGDLGVGHERGLVRGQVAGEGVVELLAVQEQVAVAGRQDRRHRCPGRRVRDQGVDRLALVRRERRDVDQPGHARIAAGLGDDDAAVGVAHEHGLTLDVVEDLLDRGHVPLQRDRRVLHNRDPVSLGTQPVVDTAPARAVDEAAVDEDHCGSRCVHRVPPWVVERCAMTLSREAGSSITSNDWFQ